MPTTQPNGGISAASKQHTPEQTGYSYTINLVNCVSGRGSGPNAGSYRIFNTSCDFFESYYDAANTMNDPSLIGDGDVRPQFVVISIYNDDKNSWLEGQLNSGNLRFKLKTQGSNHPFNVNNMTLAYSEIADGICLPITNSYFQTAASNPYNDKMFVDNVNSTNRSADDLLATQMHPGQKSSWNSTNRTWAKRRTFVSKTPALGAVVDPTNGTGTGIEEVRYLQLKLQYYDAFLTQWSDLGPYQEHAVLINNFVNSTKQLALGGDNYDSPIERGAYLAKHIDSNQGWLPGGNNGTWGETLFNNISNFENVQVFAYNGVKSESSPGSSAHIDEIRQHTMEGWNAGYGTSCLQWGIGGSAIGGYLDKMHGSQGQASNSIYTVTSGDVSVASSMFSAEGIYNQFGSCTQGTNFKSNETGTNKHNLISLDDFYMCTELILNVIDDTQFGGGVGAGNTQFGSNPIIYNSPKCPHQNQWSQYVDLAIIPAPTNNFAAPKSELWFMTKVGNPGGWDKMFIYNNGSATPALSMAGNAYFYNGNLMHVGTNSNWEFVEPRALCVQQIKNHKSLYGVDITQWQLNGTHATCNSDGTLKVEIVYNYDPNWAALGPTTWSIPIECEIWDVTNATWYTSIFITLTEGQGGGPQSATITGVPPGTYTFGGASAGPVTSTEYFNETGDVFDGEGQIQAILTPSTYSFTVNSGATTFTPSITSTNVTCNGGQDGTITVNTNGAGFTNPVTVTCTPGSLGVGSTVIGPSNGFNFLFTGLNAGTHALSFLDGAGCTHTDSITITQPSSLWSVTDAATAPTTCIELNGSITLTPSNGTAPYSVTWTDPLGVVYGPTSSLTKTFPCRDGLWTYTITDSGGCPGITQTVTVPAAATSGIGNVLSWTDPTSVGGTDGTLDIFTAGQNQVICNIGTNNPSVTWTTTSAAGNQGASDTSCNPWSPTNTLLQYTGLAAGTITVTSCFNGCCETRDIDIVNPIALTCTATASIIACGTTTGTVTADTPTGGSTVNFDHYEYYLCTNSAMTTGCIGPQVSNVFSGLAAGTYYLTVTDWFGPGGTIIGQTSAPATATITTQQSPAAVFSATNALCSTLDGKITLDSVGAGTPPYQYYTTPASTGFQSGPIPWIVGTFINLPVDSYTIITEDANGCIDTDVVAITAPATIVIGTLTPTDATCGLNNNGTLAFTAASGGTGTLTYKVINAGGSAIATQTTTTTITGLASGTYTFEVSDASGCSESISFIIGITSLTLTTSKSDQSCNHPPSNDGSINLTVAGGAPTYTYAWTGPSGYTASTEDITGLAVGTYNVTVTDSNGCVGTTTVDILLSNDTLENLTLTEILSACPGGCAGVVVDVNGGDFPLYLEISENSGATWTRVSTVANTGAAQFNENTPAPFFGAGITINSANYFKENTPNRFCFTNGTTYQFRTLSVVNGCPSYVSNFSPSASNYIPQTLTETLTQATCCACNNSSCNGAINVVITNGVPIAQGAGGSPGTLSFDWILKKDGIDITSIVTYAVSCNGGCTNTEYNEIDFTDLYPGDYEFISTDDCGEVMTETWTMIDPRVYITNIVSSDQLCANGCADGTITITATGGTSGILEYSIDDGITWSSSNVFTGVGQGVWRVWARDPMCATQILFDPTDNVLTNANGCYSDYIAGIWPAGTSISVSSVSALDLQHISTTHNSLPGSTDGEIVVNITAGTAPYEISVVTAATSTPFDACTAQTSGVLTPGLSQYININGGPVDVSGITVLSAGGTVTLDNLSVAQNWNSAALEAWYRITVKDSTGCISSIESMVDNGTLGIIGIYSATDCDCNCPEGYSLITPAPTPPALPCAGLIDVAPIDHGLMDAPGSIQQFGGANGWTAQYGNPNGGVLYVDSVSNNATTFISTADTFYKSVGAGTAPYNMQFAGTSTVLIPALDSNSNVVQYGSIFSTRLFDIGIWLNQGQTVPALPINEWIGIPIEINFASQAKVILGIAAHGNYRVSLDCALLFTSETLGGTQSPAVDANNYSEYSMFPIAMSAGKHTLLIEVKNSTVNNANYAGGIAFDLFQGELSNGLSVTSVFSTATVQATLDPYLLADINGNPITSRDINGAMHHPFQFGITDGYECASGCARINGGIITCQSDDTATCDLPINCPEYLIDLVECVGTLSNEVHAKMISGLLGNNLSVKEVWLVMIIKYLINHLNPCISMQDLLSWTKFLEDICPDCESSTNITEIPEDQGTPYGGGNLTEFDF